MPAARRRRIDATIAQLRALLPPDWSVGPIGQKGDVTVLRLADAGGAEGALPLLTTDQLEPRDVRGMWLPPDESALVSAGWLSERSRDLLRERGASYIDRTGNVEIRLARPGLYIRTEGATRDPNPRPSKAPSSPSDPRSRSSTSARRAKRRWRSTSSGTRTATSRPGSATGSRRPSCR